MINNKERINMVDDYINCVDRAHKYIYVDTTLEKRNPIEIEQKQIAYLTKNMHTDIDSNGVSYLLKLAKVDMNEHLGAGLDYLEEAKQNLQENNQSKKINGFLVCCDIMSDSRISSNTKDIILESIDLGIPYKTIAQEAKLQQIFDRDIEVQKQNEKEFNYEMRSRTDNIKQFVSDLDSRIMSNESKEYLNNIAPFIPYPIREQDSKSTNDNLIKMVDKIFDKGSSEEIQDIQEIGNNFIQNSKTGTINNQNFEEFRGNLKDVYQEVAENSKQEKLSFEA